MILCFLLERGGKKKDTERVVFFPYLRKKSLVLFDSVVPPLLKAYCPKYHGQEYCSIILITDNYCMKNKVNSEGLAHVQLTARENRSLYSRSISSALQQKYAFLFHTF